MRIKKCSACNGSGVYDNTGSPPCSACRGLGIERSNIPYRIWKHIVIKYLGKSRHEIEAIYEKDKFPV